MAAGPPKAARKAAKTKAAPPRTTPQDIRELVQQVQRALNGKAGTRLPIDGVLGPATQEALRAIGVSAGRDDAASLLAAVTAIEALEPAERSVALEPSVWVFYATPEGGVGDLKPGGIDFWRHGLAQYGRGGAAHSATMKRGDTAVILNRDAVVGTGILAADRSSRFADAENRRYWPVLIERVFATPYSRQAVEETAGPLVRQTGTVHAVRPSALEALSSQIASGETAAPGLPYPPEDAEAALASGEPIADALRRTPDVLPDQATAEALGWEGPVWQGPPTGEDGGGTEKPAAPDVDARIPFVSDAPNESEDELERGPFALFLAQRLHLIWCELNGYAPSAAKKRRGQFARDADTFIVHVDSPWGGGKTTFANFIARVLDPSEETLTEGHFLRASVATTVRPDKLAGIDLSEVFVPAFAKREPDKWPKARRPWIVARYNAWRDQYVQPPWWQIFLTIQAAIIDALWRDVTRAAGDLFSRGSGRALLTILDKLWRRAYVWTRRYVYQLSNPKLVGQLVLLGVLIGGYFLINRLGVLDDLTEAEGSLNFVVAALGIGGVSIATLLTLIRQSLAPDLDFAAENKQIGIRDPISRFRHAFQDILHIAQRPVLLIVDDVDRCEPATVVEILRGFQTMVRSPRLFVLLLGDRAWIEAAHEIRHKEQAIAAAGLESGLGARFVEKVIQLSFRLPAMKPEAREQFALSVLRGRSAATSPRPDEDLERTDGETALRELEQELEEIVLRPHSVSRREDLVNAAKLKAREKGAEADHVDGLANLKLVAGAGGDSGQQAEVFNAVSRLADSLPNNPRQIKRIFMSFGTYETVGRIYMNYQATRVGKDGELRARRWRQLAMWVTLATEWPETWRALGRRPELLDVAYSPADTRAEVEQAFFNGLSEDDGRAAKAILRRLRNDASLVALLSPRTAAEAPANADVPALSVEAFAATSMEAAAITEFNRIIWEPGFRL